MKEYAREFGLGICKGLGYFVVAPSLGTWLLLHIPQTREWAIGFLFRLAPPDRAVLPISLVLYLLGFLLFLLAVVFSLAHRVGIGEVGEIRRIKVGLHRLRDSFRSPAERQRLADDRKRSDDAAFHDRLMAHQRSQRGEID
jgi:hypothetical protein